MHIVRFLAPELEGDDYGKDIDFTPTGITRALRGRLRRTRRRCARPQALEEPVDPMEGVIIPRMRRSANARRQLNLRIPLMRAGAGSLLSPRPRSSRRDGPRAAWAATLRARRRCRAVSRGRPRASEQAARAYSSAAIACCDPAKANEWVAFVGIALSAKAGLEAAGWSGAPATGSSASEIAVAPKQYASQHLKVPPGQVDLSKEHLTRYEARAVHLSEVLRTFTDSAPATLAMLQPRRGALELVRAAPLLQRPGARAPQRDGLRGARGHAGSSPRMPGASSIPAITSSRAHHSSSTTGRACSRSMLTWKPSTRPWRRPYPPAASSAGWAPPGRSTGAAPALLGLISNAVGRRPGAFLVQD